MITRTDVIEKLRAHLSGDLTETQLVVWAEDAFVALSESDEPHKDEALLLDILGYIGAGDAPGFPLTWTVLSTFLDRLGAKVKVEVA